MVKLKAQTHMAELFPVKLTTDTCPVGVEHVDEDGLQFEAAMEQRHAKRKLN